MLKLQFCTYNGLTYYRPHAKDERPIRRLTHSNRKNNYHPKPPRQSRFWRFAICGTGFVRRLIATTTQIGVWYNHSECVNHTPKKIAKPFVWARLIGTIVPKIAKHLLPERTVWSLRGRLLWWWGRWGWFKTKSSGPSAHRKLKKS